MKQAGICHLLKWAIHLISGGLIFSPRSNHDKFFKTIVSSSKTLYFQLQAMALMRFIARDQMQKEKKSCEDKRLFVPLNYIHRKFKIESLRRSLKGVLDETLHEWNFDIEIKLMEHLLQKSCFSSCTINTFCIQKAT